MTTRNLDALFHPAAIALIGASEEARAVGAVAAKNMLGGGFAGRVMLVNPHHVEVFGACCYASVASLPERPDLAVIATPAPTVPGLVADLAKAGCRAVIVLTAGLSPELRQQMLDAARPTLMRILGPNCLGLLSPAAGINASFAQAAAHPGGLALLSQSGAVATVMLDWANAAGVGFSHIVSLGDMSDIDFGDCLDYLAFDPATHAILIYAESVSNARKFMSAARIAARAKPVIIVKSGRSSAGASAATSHTGALAGSDLVYDAAIRRAGALRVDTLRDLFDAAEGLTGRPAFPDDRLMIITNGGGLGVLAADELALRGGELALLSNATKSALDKVLPPSWSKSNPIDILGDAQEDRYEAALAALAAQCPDQAVLVVNCPTGVSDSVAAADAVIRAAAQASRLRISCCWSGGSAAAAGRAMLAAAGLPVYDTPEAAVHMFQRRVEHARNRSLLAQAPPAGGSAGSAHAAGLAKSIIASVLKEGRSTLTGPESRGVLEAYGIHVTQARVAGTPAAAGAAAQHLNGPVALKILSRDITHKSDVGGVRLGLSGANAVRQAAEEMLKAVRASAPKAHVDGFTVEPMISRPMAVEVLAGIASDPTFGPSILFGQGGVATEIIGDRAIALPPLNAPLARDLVSRTRVSRLLAGYRDRPPANADAIDAVLIALSDLAADIPEVAELDINPLLVDANGAIALDARIVVRPASSPGAARLAIRPYPAKLQRAVEFADAAYTIRAILPEDGARLIEMARLTSEADLRFRFHGSMRSLSPDLANRLAQIDYDREMGLVAEEKDGRLAGVVRLAFDPEIATAEIALLVRSDAQQRGLGRHLISEALSYARSRGASLVFGDIMRDNGRALDLCVHLGARRAASPNGASLCRVEFDFHASQPAAAQA